MAAVPTSELTPQERDELLCTYAALILHDDKKEITAENINKIITAAGTKVEGYWPSLFARAISTTNVGELLTKIGTPGASAAPAAAAAGGASPKATDKKSAAKVEEKKEEEEEEADMGFSLFD